MEKYSKRNYATRAHRRATSILRFFTKRFRLPMLPGLAARDLALKKHGQPAMGDLTAALGLHQ
jgi:phospholipase C